MSAHKVTALTVSADTFATMSDKRKDALRKAMSSQVREFVTGHLTDDWTLPTFASTFVDTFGAQADVESGESFARLVRERHAIAVRVTVETMAARGDLVTGKGKRGKVSQAALAKALQVSQPRVSQVLTAWSERETQRSQVSAIVDAARESGLMPTGKDDASKDAAAQVREAARLAVKSGQADSALAAVKAGKVPTVAAQAASVAEVSKVVERLDAILAGGIAVTDDTREEARRIAANLRRLADVITPTPVTVRKSA